MGKLILVNGVETVDSKSSLIPGNSNATLTKEGGEQCIALAERIHKLGSRIDAIAVSDEDYLKKFVHHIRSKSPSDKILRHQPVYTEALRERNFGVLIGSRHSMDSDLFNHTRICAENGESIAQCRKRLMKFITGFCVKQPKGNVLAVSHSFACQIISNVILNKDHTTLSSFWMNKCSFAIFNYKSNGAVVSQWRFNSACNITDDRQYTEEELYCRLSST